MSCRQFAVASVTLGPAALPELDFIVSVQTCGQFQGSDGSVHGNFARSAKDILTMVFLTRVAMVKVLDGIGRVESTMKYVWQRLLDAHPEPFQ